MYMGVKILNAQKLIAQSKSNALNVAWISQLNLGLKVKSRFIYQHVPHKQLPNSTLRRSTQDKYNHDYSFNQEELFLLDEQLFFLHKINVRIITNTLIY